MAGKKKGSTMKALSVKEARLLREYLFDLNKTKAGIRAGYSQKGGGVHVRVIRILGRPHVKAALDAALAARNEESDITQERVLTETALLSFSDITHYLVDQKGNVSLALSAPEGAMRAVQSIKRRFSHIGTGETAITTCDVEIRLWDKPGPLKLAGRHVGLFPNKVEVTGTDGEPIGNVVFYMPENQRGKGKG